MLTALFGAATIGLIASTVYFANNGGGSSESAAVVSNTTVIPTTRPPTGENPCAGKKLDFENVQCIIDEIEQTGEQAGGNVTKGYNGTKETDVVPITKPYFQAGLCPVNVHWHLGAEHLSLNEYDSTGSGPSDIQERRRLAGKARLGNQCKFYDENDEKFTKKFDWQHCIDMEVGQTYEVHWPHSAAGACGTLNQFQTPFYDGVFCNLDMETFSTLGRQDIASAVGVQAQVFTIVNDEAYYYPDLMRGMIVDGDFGSDIAMYTGSTTGDTRDNEVCSQYTPITWQVDRKCHLISASTFDKMCADMKAQRDDMSDDLYAHGSRETVADNLAANNHANLRRV
jgi:Delta carbonic anhydrase